MTFPSSGDRPGGKIEMPPSVPGSPLDRLAQGERLPIRELRRLIHQLGSAAAELQVWSRRYCDGRRTYAPSDHNRATATLLRAGLVLEIPDGTPWASDGDGLADDRLSQTPPESLVPGQARLDAEALLALDLRWPPGPVREVRIQALLTPEAVAAALAAPAHSPQRVELAWAALREGRPLLDPGGQD